MEENKRYYLSEFVYFDGDHHIVLNIVDICKIKNEIYITITDEGKITVRSFDLKHDGKNLYFEYGIAREQIEVNDL